MAMNPRLMRPLAKTPPGTPASLLLRFNGANESTSFIDSSPSNLTVTASGNAQISTAQSKWGGSAGYFLAANDMAEVADDSPFDFGSDDWTIEFWFYGQPSELAAILHKTSYTNSQGFVLWVYDNAFNLTNKMTMMLNGTAFTLTTTSDAFVTDEWTHIAVVRSGNTVTIYSNGVPIGSDTFSGSVTLAADSPFAVGSIDNRSWNQNTALNGFVDDLRIVPGLAVYTGPFIPPTQQLSAYATPVPVQREASLLLHFDGEDESTVFTDDSVNALTVTANGNAQISTAESKWGGASGYFDGDGDYLTVTAPAIGTSDFTLEAWARFSSFADYRNIWESRQDDGGSAGFVFGANSAGQLYVYTDSNFQLQGGSLSLDTWHHVALVRKAGVWSMYIDGVDTTATYTSAADLSFTAVRIGADWASLYFMDGYIDDLRLTPGLAVYTGPFVPPTAPLTPISTPQPIEAQASLLLHFDGTDGTQVFDDSSVNDLTVTYTGTAELSDTHSKHGGTAVYLDGAGSTLEVPQDGAVSGAGDWTVEMWAYPVSPPFPDSNPYEVWLASDTSAGFSSALNENGTVTFGESLVGTVGTTTNSVVFDEWNHIAWCRKNGVIKIFINGVEGVSFSYSTSIPAGVMRVGSDGGNPSVLPYVGYIDDLRVVKGLAVYTSTFTPPTAPLSATVTPV